MKERKNRQKERNGNNERNETIEFNERKIEIKDRKKGKTERND